jgi:serine palmitoyltransferase
VIATLKQHSPAHLSAGSMSSPAAVQIISALELIMGRDGSNRGEQKIAQLRDNANYMRTKLTEMGCLVLGDYDSPILVNPLLPSTFPQQDHSVKDGGSWVLLGSSMTPTCGVLHVRFFNVIHVNNNDFFPQISATCAAYSLKASTK